MRPITYQSMFALMMILITVQAAAKSSTSFFDCTIIDNNGTEHELNNVTCHTFGLGGSKNPHFECKRFTPKESKFKIGFDVVKSIHIVGTMDKPHPKHIAARILKIDGEEFTCYIHASQGKVSGIKNKLFRKKDQSADDHQFPITQVDTIIFPHTGYKSQCPACGSYFHNPAVTTCPFDRDILKIVTKGHSYSGGNGEIKQAGISLLVPVTK